MGKYSVESFPDSGVWNTFQTLTDTVGIPYSRAESCYDESHGASPYEVGGPFRKVKIELDAAGSGAVGIGSYITNWQTSISGFGFGYVKYTGGFGYPTYWPGTTEDVANISGPSSIIGLNSSIVPSTSTLDSMVWDKTKPKIENGGLAVAIAELRDVPQMLQTSAKAFALAWNAVKYKYFIPNHAKELITMAPKGASDQFLNHNFGWVPFIKDLTALCDNVIHVDSRIDKLMHDNGNWVRRKAILVNGSDVTKLGGDTGSLCFPSNTVYLLGSMTGNPSYEVYKEKTSLAYGVGRFRYYQPYLDARSPESQGMLGPIRRQLALHGARLTPANVYKAVPWTWLIDWVSDTGRTINAINDWAVDGLTAKYLYLVHHQILTYRIIQRLPFNAKSGGDKVLSFSRIIDVKQRKEAESPFGFGLTWDNLSPKQLAILGALGISRIR
jgi:hypothetical protein